MLYLIATPIGNLEDIPNRALRILQECDAILCEDTRHSTILLHHYGIHKPLTSYHRFKEAASLETIVSDLQAGKTLALISDAGTPCISDPGTRLVYACIEKNIPFTAIPGPCSVIQAIVLSGFMIDRFQWVGFLPKDPSHVLRQALFYPGATVAFESPERLVSSLKILQTLDPNRKIAVAREMTKKFEECIRGSAEELLVHFTKTSPKGEIALVIAPGSSPQEHLPMEECIELLRTWHGLSLKDAIKQTARILKVPKRTVYNTVHKQH